MKIECRNLKKNYKAKEVLQGVNLTLEKERYMDLSEETVQERQRFCLFCLHRILYLPGSFF